MSRLLSVSVPDALADEAEALASRLGTTKSDVVRDALRAHLLRSRIAEARRDGRSRAEPRGVGPEDVERLIDEVRAARRR